MFGRLELEPIGWDACLECARSLLDLFTTKKCIKGFRLGYIVLKFSNRASEVVAQRAQRLIAKTDNCSLILGSHALGKN